MDINGGSKLGTLLEVVSGKGQLLAKTGKKVTGKVGKNVGKLTSGVKGRIKSIGNAAINKERKNGYPKELNGKNRIKNKTPNEVNSPGKPLDQGSSGEVENPSSDTLVNKGTSLARPPITNQGQSDDVTTDDINRSIRELRGKKNEIEKKCPNLIGEGQLREFIKLALDYGEETALRTVKETSNGGGNVIKKNNELKNMIDNSHNKKSKKTKKRSKKRSKKTKKRSKSTKNRSRKVKKTKRL